MDDQSVYMSYALPENLARKPSEYMTSGRFFASLVIHEGEKMARMVTDFLGDGVLMYSSDYPHAESRFPESTNKVLDWKSLGDRGHAKNAVGQRDEMFRRAVGRRQMANYGDF